MVITIEFVLRVSTELKLLFDKIALSSKKKKKRE